MWRPDGSAAAGNTDIKILSTTGVSVLPNARTNAFGYYRFGGVPEGEFRLQAVDTNNLWVAEAEVIEVGNWIATGIAIGLWRLNDRNGHSVVQVLLLDVRQQIHGQADPRLIP